ncbi:hypothetical protein Fcan01_03667 [Folsomia candida]|uniref:Uncharacterized protein n=1 Tax=Folsomia candida TaxID=158441 RepID=A0A226EZV1_FOLCA|nr:hypothetical protein Fcan01_03667 [Folsomia candida]
MDRDYGMLCRKIKSKRDDTGSFDDQKYRKYEVTPFYVCHRIVWVAGVVTGMIVKAKAKKLREQQTDNDDEDAVSSAPSRTKSTPVSPCCVLLDHVKGRKKTYLRTRGTTTTATSWFLNPIGEKEEILTKRKV